ncbi:MAG: acyl-CoA dehydrogenase family protein [Candidatus Aminicenantes bacterium]|nr:acyl-CoA dehydrogenase family protein [Candidatus Aminicenantes bacterium]
MDFSLTEEQKLLKEMVREFAEKEIAPYVDKWEEEHHFPREIFRKLGKLGLLGMTANPEYSGTKSDYLSFILVLEELSRVSASVALTVSVHSSLFIKALQEYGQEELKKKYLTAAARGEILGAFSLSEPGAGSDASNLQTKAYQKGDYYIINGIKSWVTTGSEAEAFILFAVTSAEKEKKKISAFLVDKKMPGIQILKLEKKMGFHSSPTAQIAFEDCPVPATNLIGEEGRGLAIALRLLDGSRIGIAAQAVGLAQQALELGIRYAKEREAFGQKIANFEAIQFMLADAATLIEASRLLTYQAALLVDYNLPYTKEASMAKLFASETANKVTYLALQIHGGYGYCREYPIERLFREARVTTIYEGTSEIQRIVIARQLLKEAEGQIC